MRGRGRRAAGLHRIVTLEGTTCHSLCLPAATYYCPNTKRERKKKKTCLSPAFLEALAYLQFWSRQSKELSAN